MHKAVALTLVWLSASVLTLVSRLWGSLTWTAIPGAAVTALALYFYFERLGSRVKVTYTVKGELLHAGRIASLTLINLKNKPVTIFEIVAVVDKKLLAPVEKFEPPLILKPLESLHVETKPFTAYLLGDVRCEPNFAFGRIAIYLVLVGGKTLRCHLTGRPPARTLKKFNSLQELSKDTWTFNGHVYNELAKYAIAYQKGGEGAIKTAFLLKSGMISGEWDFHVNALETAALATPVKVRGALEVAGFGVTQLGNYQVYALGITAREPGPSSS